MQIEIYPSFNPSIRAKIMNKLNIQQKQNMLMFGSYILIIIKLYLTQRLLQKYIILQRLCTNIMFLYITITLISKLIDRRASFIINKKYYRITNMNQNSFPQERDISSSQDNCKCNICKNQEDSKQGHRQNLSNLYMYKHLKKRGGPPIKKQTLIKQLSLKAKFMSKKQEAQKKIQIQKNNATPTKYKLIQVLKSKEGTIPSYFIDYHAVSHSQRQKFPSKDAQQNLIDQTPRRFGVQQLKSAFLRQSRPQVASMRLIQISQNPENIRVRNNLSRNRSLSQASPPCFEQKRSAVKSQEKQRIQ